METNIITIVGNIGSGKSTLLPLVAQELRAKMLDADSLFQTVDPFRELYLNNIPRWAFANELWLTTERTKLLDEHLKHFPKKTTVVDSGLLMSWVYTYSHFVAKNITKAEWDLYQDLFKHFMFKSFNTSLVIFLDCSIKTLLKRIKLRGRDYELKFYTPQYLRQIEKGLLALKKQFKVWKMNCVTITERQAGNFESTAADQIRVIKIIRSYKEKQDAKHRR